MLTELNLLTEYHIFHLERWANFDKDFSLDKNIAAATKSLKRLFQCLSVDLLAIGELPFSC